MWGDRKVVTLGPVSDWLKHGEKGSIKRIKEQLDIKVFDWHERLEGIKEGKFLLRWAAATAVLYDIDAFIRHHIAPPALMAFAGPNNSNPDQGAFSGDGHILLNMVIYAGAGFIISLILKYMGRGELSMIAICITGFVILRQFVFILRELMNDVLTMVHM